ncbi:MAG: DUF1559 domain-containing protein, partial [Planctomycetales bacterium]|nr:DUF1559 domain-containing protein [Planctomycetales bacterium]
VATSRQWGSSWLIYILPYLEAQNLYNQWDFASQSGFTNAGNMALVQGVTIPIYRCPSTPVAGFHADRNLMNVS